jgi:hypothetical protein
VLKRKVAWKNGSAAANWWRILADADPVFETPKAPSSFIEITGGAAIRHNQFFFQHEGELIRTLGASRRAGAWAWIARGIPP